MHSVLKYIVSLISTQWDIQVDWVSIFLKPESVIMSIRVFMEDELLFQRDKSESRVF